MPTDKHTIVKVFLINLLPFKFDKWAPKKPPTKDPNISTINKFGGIDPILVKEIAPTAFQKIPTVKNVKLTALRKSIPYVLINNIVTNKPLPEEIEPFKIPIIKIRIANLNFLNKLSSLFTDNNPKSDLWIEYKANKTENIPNNK